MPPIESLFSFILASMIIAFVPGPSMLYAAAQTISLGRKAGWWSAFGFHAAGLIHVTTASVGITALLTAQPKLMIIMQYVGGGYLAWMGWNYFFSNTDSLSTGKLFKKKTSRKAFSDSVIVEILNAKSYVFFFLYLPQFADPNDNFPIWMQICVLGLAVNVLFTITDLISVEASSFLVGTVQRGSNMINKIHKIGGAILILLGLNIAFSEGF